tara:strand:- start:172 stop:387 length:216 start_codon:yes stop_codon:yes gene_type:complete
MKDEEYKFKTGDLIETNYGSTAIYVVVEVYAKGYENICLAKIRNIATGAVIIVETRYYKMLGTSIQHSEND